VKVDRVVEGEMSSWVEVVEKSELGGRGVEVDEMGYG
jgi:hypothetical protein